MHSPAYEVVLDRQSPLFDDCASLRFGIHLDPTVPMRAAGSGGWDRTQDLRVNLRSVGAGAGEQVSGIENQQVSIHGWAFLLSG